MTPVNSSPWRTPQLLSQLSWLALALAGAHVLAGLGMAVVGNTSGWLGGVFYAAFYALPLVLIALALRSQRRGLNLAAAWLALALAVFYVLIVVGNWSGYSPSLAVFAVAITAPTAVLDLVVFWATVLRRGPRLRPSNPA